MMEGKGHQVRIGETGRFAASPRLKNFHKFNLQHGNEHHKKKLGSKSSFISIVCVGMFESSLKIHYTVHRSSGYVIIPASGCRFDMGVESSHKALFLIPCWGLALNGIHP